ncbi:MAG: galactose mutarotase [Rhodobacteraceae bacterium]|nr:galactose mutarotase [Paracoccaceae bacterium]
MIASQAFGRHAGRAVTAFTLADPGGISVTLADFGAALVRCLAPDRAGRIADVVLGFDDAAGYAASRSYFGATVGRVANRIAGARFTLDGQTFALSPNEGPNQLHGGPEGFSRRIFDAEPAPDGRSIAFRLVSPDGDQGYPGRLEAVVRYAVAGHVLTVEATATTDRPTPCNLAHHSYWNLAGHDAGPILDHRLAIRASAFLPTDGALLPTGEIRPVAGTRHDFRAPAPVGAAFARAPDGTPAADEAGFDANWCLDPPHGRLREVARLVDPASGRQLALSTDQPGLQVYTGGHLGADPPGKGGARYGRFGGIALEAQGWPDAPNRPHFPPVILRPGEVLRQTTVFDLTPA